MMDECWIKIDLKIDGQVAWERFSTTPADKAVTTALAQTQVDFYGKSPAVIEVVDVTAKISDVGTKVEKSDFKGELPAKVSKIGVITKEVKP
jgi:hypothetical protein